MVVGIAGAYGSGKDEAASVLTAEFGFERVNFADALKAEVAATLPLTLAAYADEYNADVRGIKDSEWLLERRRPLSVTDLLQEHKPPVIRALLQEWGTELRRREDAEYWVRRWSARVAAIGGLTHIVSTDVRFPNEATAIKAMGGRLVKILRPGFAGDSHASERGLDHWTEWDAEWRNDRSLPLFHEEVRAWARRSLPINL